ncbi:MAG TPA: radical SAM protein [bacterium]|nr:radical SAM protein [bacterium]
MRRTLTIGNLWKAFQSPAVAASLLKGVAKAAIGYHLGNGYSLKPGKVFCALTGCCNLKCVMCPQGNHPGFEGDLRQRSGGSLEDLIKLAAAIAPFRPFVAVSGGEPFLHPHWREFVREIKRWGMICWIGTNGTMLERDAADLVEIGVDSISVSMDGPRDVHDRIRGVAGTFDLVAKGIRELTRIRERTGRKKPEITAIFTITPHNSTHIPEMVEMVSSLGVDVLRIGHLNFLTREEFESHSRLFQEVFKIDLDTSWEGFIASPDAIDSVSVAEAVAKFRDQRNTPLRITFFPNFTPEETQQYYTSRRFRSTSFRNACMSAWDTAIVGPEMELILCPNYVLGSLRQESFERLWNCEKAVVFRRTLRRMKSFPACSRACCFFYM